MLVGIITEETKEYYIFTNSDNSFYMREINGNKAKNLDLNDSLKTLRQLFISNLTFYKKENENYIFTDESGYKRFFKNGIEDFYLFFENNGTNAVLNKSNNNFDKKQNSVKLFCFKNKESIKKVLLNICLVSIISDGFLVYNLKNTQIEGKTISLEKECEIKISTNYIEELINKSTLSSEEKYYIINNNLIGDVVACSKGTTSNSYIFHRDYELYERFNGIKTRRYQLEESDSYGYYNPLEPNCIHLYENLSEDNYLNVFSHEFVHLLQFPTQYLYICESSAELISHEYFNTPLDGYVEEVKRLKVLLEIIGPEIIFNENFKKNDYKFEMMVNELLDQRDAEKFYRLIKTGASDWKDKEAEFKINSELDELLKKMYFNKTGKYINDNPIINNIYSEKENSLSTPRIYFNKNHEHYSDEYNVCTYSKFLGVLPSVDEIKSSKQITTIKYYKTVRVPLNDAQNYDKTNVVHERDIEEIVPGYSVIEQPSYNPPKIFDNEGNEISIDDANRLGLITMKREYLLEEEIKYLDYSKAATSDYIKLEFADGTYAIYKYNSNDKSLYCSGYYQEVTENCPSIKKEIENGYFDVDNRNHVNKRSI